MHQLNAGEGILGRIKRLKAQHRSRHPLHASMILLDDVVEILDLADFDRSAVIVIVALDGRGIGVAAIDGDLVRDAVATNGLVQEAPSRLFIPLLGQQKINGLAKFINGTIEIEQNPRNSRRNELPTELINRPLLMGHKHLAGAPIELMQIVKTASRSNHLFHASPEAFNRIEMVTAVGR